MERDLGYALQFTDLDRRLFVIKVGRSDLGNWMSRSIRFTPLATLLLVLSLFLYSSTSLAANALRWESLRQPYFQKIDTDAKPLDGPVSAFAQDREGFIWLVAGSNLWRWDAYQFTAAVALKNETLPVVQIIKADPDGALWVGTANGLFRVMGNSLNLQRVNVPGLNAQSIQHLAFDYSGGRQRVFIASVNQVLEWDVHGQKVQSTNIDGTPSNRIHAFHLDELGQLWVGTTEGLLQKTISGASNNLLHRFEQWPEKTRVAAIFTDHEKRLWVGTTVSGLFFLDDRQQFKKIELPEHEGDEFWIYSINEVRPGMLWLGTFGDGILEYDTRRKTFKQIKHNRLLKTSLQDNNVWSLFRDQRGLVLVGGGNGFNLYDATQTALIHIPGDIDAGGLSDTQIHSVIAMPDDKLWLGTGMNGIDIVDPLQSNVSHIPAAAPALTGTGLSNDAIEAMLLVDSNTVLTSSNWQTLAVDRSSKIARALHPEGRVSDAYSSAFAIYRNSIWVAGTDGLWRVPDLQTQAAKNVFSLQTGERRIASVLSDGDNLWLGTWKGLKQLREATKPPFVIDIKSIKDPILDQQFISSMVIDKNNRLWLGTSGGGLFFKNRDEISAGKAWSNITDTQGLPSNSISSVQVDPAGNIWTSTSRGIAFIEQYTLKVSSILPNEGAAASPYIRASGTRNVAGEIIFGGAEGLTIVQPTQWHAASYRPKVVLTGIETNTGKKIELEVRQTKGEKLETHLNIAPDINRVTIEFAALDYLAPMRIHYRYRLLGFDDHWREIDAKNRAATFTSLAPDTYKMQVQYSYDGHEWLDSPLSLTIDVARAWYQQWWLRIVVLALFFWLLYALFRWRVGLYRQQQYLLEIKVSERTAALEQANCLLKEKSIEVEEASLTDPLTGLRNRRFLTQHIDADTSLILRRYQDQHEAGKLPPQNTDLIFYLIDIDNFKRVNDTWGHAVGDAVLIEMRRRLMAVFRDSDYLIRWGGEEFLAVARDTSRDKALALAERIRQAIVSEQFSIGLERQISVSCSVGYAAFPFVVKHADVLSWGETLSIADAALYKAKELGRDTWVGFDTASIEFSKEQIAMLKLKPKSVFKIEALKIQTTGKT
jgi:diguanylate cyclase (GGDEF)-like protein